MSLEEYSTRHELVLIEYTRQRPSHGPLMIWWFCENAEWKEDIDMKYNGCFQPSKKSNSDVLRVILEQII